MSVNLTCFTLLVLSCISAAIGTHCEEAKVWQKETMERYGDTCMTYMSEETAELFEDDPWLDNKETRDFKLCMAKSRGYIDNGVINVKQIMVDFKYYMKSSTFVEVETAKQIISVCKEQAEQHETEADVAAKFEDCTKDRSVSSDLFEQ